MESTIERSVPCSAGPDLSTNFGGLFVRPESDDRSGQSLLDLERDHIRHTLLDTNGVIGGKHGAASRLGLKRTTLQYKMKKLEIHRH
jgi:transcriptional regulator with GAF, ATPase, and Fis domain